jgi:quinol monooxygenase YgiN
VKVQPAHWEAAVALAKRHVATSRLEPGCASHRYFVDPERECTLVFVEEWQDQAAVDHHFAQPYSREFARAFKDWCEGELGLDIHRIADTRRLTI